MEQITLVDVNMKNSTKGILVAGAVGAGAVLVYLATRPVVGAQGLTARFGGFNVNTLDSTGTTTRQSTGETAKTFRFYPLINVTPDVNGSYTVNWDWANTVDGVPTGSSGPTPTTPSITDITNIFAGLVGGQAVQLQLTDNRAGNTENGAIAIGDATFIYLGKQDGQWHTFTSTLAIKITSPSGATVTLTGQLNDNFKSVGALSASFAGFALNKIQ